MENYEQYEGKEILVVYDINGYNEEFKAVVSGCEYDIGISIEVVSDEEKEHVREFFNMDDNYLLCLPGPSSKEYKTIWYSGKENLYKQRFLYIIECIKNGSYVRSESDKRKDELKAMCNIPYLSISGMAECSFK